MTERALQQIPGPALARVGAAPFAVSTAFPVAGSVLNLDPPPRWIGIVDVGVALALVVLGIAIVAKMRALGTDVIGLAFRAYRAAASVFLVLLALFFLVGGGINWSVLLPGLAWRAWLLAYVLPAGIAAWRGET